MENKKDLTVELLGDVEIHVKSILSLHEMMEFVDYVVEMCFSDDGEYLPELREFAVMSCIVEYYTDFKLPEDVSEKYEFLYATDIAKDILCHVNIEQYKDMMTSINSKIDNLAKANIEMVNAQMNTLNREFGELMSKVEKLFSGVSQEDVSNMFKVLSGGIDENDIIKSLLSEKDGK